MIKERLTKDNYLRLLKESRGDNFTFLEEFIKSTTPILCKCNICNNEWKVAPYELIKRKSNCPVCSQEGRKKKIKKDLEYYRKKLFDYYGYNPYTFLEDDYIDCHTPIKVKCNKCGSEFKVSMTNIMNNINLHRDPYCKNCNMIEKNKIELTTKEFQEKLDDLFGEDKSYTVLSEYKGTKTKIKVRCNICKDEFEVIPQNIFYFFNKKGKRICPKCNNMKREDINLPYNERLKRRNIDIIALEEYKGRKKQILHKCNICGYEWKVTPDNILNGNRCPECSKYKTQSNGEKELIDYLKTLNVNFLVKDRNILNGKELDIYIPEKNIAIEFDGLYWHSDKFKEYNYHINKTLDCKEKGIRLIHIFEDEWNKKNEIVKIKLKHILQLNNNLPKIYARNCYVKEINNDSKKDFLNKNHIQGNDKSNIKLGLFFKDELISVMTFCKPRKPLGHNKNSSDYELSRFANDINYIVIGSFGKLFKYFKKNYQWDNIITYADRRWSEGTVYYKNNFILDHISKPNYWYTNNSYERKYRYTFRKQNLKKLFPDIYSDDKTEKEIMKEAGYLRIYDCGNLVFIYKNGNS